ncbi:SAM-dependent methyltransferase [Methanocalculus taiwanensis]|uniref:SAM-dependent methyltransferase n=1 Tax=Methanocalculus taiwanensis TaxID=106207 RepID=A0ABD4TMB0_9EURY|nr:SAM-dependent methyltransferase [Methanocalculus taiwanensis]MCQ1538975.1 SAM-dependent methyltransferase [Methanocalculus taiwanensis]
MRAKILSADELSALPGYVWVDRSHRPYRDGDIIYVPVQEGEPYDTIIPDRRRRGRGYQRLGDTILFHGKRPTPDDIDDILSREEPECILFIPGHSGSLRIPSYEVIRGMPHEVLHRECGISYRLDPSKVMFSQGNRGEKDRIRSQVSSSGKKERIADMFAGIGYFTLPAAVSGGYVHAMEKNPDSYQYLLRNIRENDLSDQVVPACGDCRDLLSGIYDRVIMGHFDAADYLECLTPHVHYGSIIHLHTVNPDSDHIKALLSEDGFEAEITVHRIKKYAPRIWHSVMDVVIR